MSEHQFVKVLAIDLEFRRCKSILCAICVVSVIAAINITKTMGVLCAICTENISSDASIQCYGICGHSYHIPCLAKGNGDSSANAHYKPVLATYLNSIANLQWYCDSCYPFTINGIAKSFADCTKSINDLKDAVVPILTKISDSNQEIENDSTGNGRPMDTSILSIDSSFSVPNSNNNNQKNNTASSQTASTSDFQAQQQLQQSNDALESSAPSPQIVQLGKRQHRDSSFDSQSSPPVKQHKANDIPGEPHSLNDLIARKQVVTSHGPISLDNLITHTPAVKSPTLKTNMMRSIYVSPFKPSTEASHILNFLMSKEDFKFVANSVKCTKLLSEKRKHRTTFVSFKLDVPRHHFGLFIDPDLWHTNGSDKFTVTEFIDKKQDASTNVNRSAATSHKPRQSQDGKAGNQHHSKNVSDSNNKHRKKQHRRHSGLTQVDHPQQPHPNRFYNPFRQREDPRSNEKPPNHCCCGKRHCGGNSAIRRFNNRR